MKSQNNQEPLQIDGSDEAIHRQLTLIASQYKILQCHSCAKEMMAWLKKNRILPLQMLLEMIMNEFNDLLRQIQKKPGLYLGKPSISSLYMFLNGYEFAPRQLGIEPSAEEQHLRDFQIWVQEKFEIKANQSWDQIILFHSMDDREAFDDFFCLFAEFCHQARQVRAESTVSWLDIPNQTQAFSTRAIAA